MFYGFFCFLAYLLMPSLPLVKDVKEQKATFPYRKLFTPDLNVFSFMQKLLFYPSLLHSFTPSHRSPERQTDLSKCRGKVGAVLLCIVHFGSIFAELLALYFV